MKYHWLVFFALIVTLPVHSQNTLWNKLQAAWEKLNNDPQLKYALAGISIIDEQTGKPIFEKNAHIGMAPASTQKVITSVAAFEALGGNYQYKTSVGYTGKIDNKILNGDVVVDGNGDPTFGSWRYTSTKPSIILQSITNAIKQKGIEQIKGNLVANNKGFDINPIPEGWIWGDMGNYYGAGHWALNWNENQYDIFNKSVSKENAPVEIINDDNNEIPFSTVLNEVKSGKPGTGDASIIFAAPYSDVALFQGKLEPGKNKLTVSGAMPEADKEALKAINNALKNANIVVDGEIKSYFTSITNGETIPASYQTITSVQSPSLDSINYWFMRKSVNLYGEAFVRTIAREKYGVGSTKKGLEWIDSFYTSIGIDSESLHLYDGSGLSPANRITPNSMAKVLLYAKGRPWFGSFYNALPIYNGMKLKSGTINRVKSFAGYHQSKSGRSFIVCIMVNNYNNSASSLVAKMFKVLDELK